MLSLLWLRFNPGPRNFSRHGQKEGKKKERERERAWTLKSD